MPGLFRVVARPGRLAARTVCTPTGFTIAFDLPPAPDARSPIQRVIDAQISEPAPSLRAILGGLELVFADGQRLSAISLYWNMLRAEAAVPLPHDAPAPAFLAPGAALDADALAFERALRVGFDRGAGRLCVGLGPAERWIALADTIWAGLTAADDLAAIGASDVTWQP